MRTHLLITGLALLCSSCTNDFGAFSFSGGDASSPLEAGAPSGDGAIDAADTEAGAESGTPSSDAAMDSSQMDSAAEGDTGPVDDGSAPGQDAAVAWADAAGDATGEVDAARRDADPVEQAACREALEPLVPSGRDSCDDCGCSQCDVEVVACLDSGDAIQDALCSAVLMCALENSCRVWDCYCISSRCSGSSLDGNGPCVEQMNAAVAGRKAEVMQVWGSGDDTEPLVRALDAVSCLIGRHPRSPGGAASGICQGDCL